MTRFLTRQMTSFIIALLFMGIVGAASMAAVPSVLSAVPGQATDCTVTHVTKDAENPDAVLVHTKDCMLRTTGKGDVFRMELTTITAGETNFYAGVKAGKPFNFTTKGINAMGEIPMIVSFTEGLEMPF